ncbi:MAG: crotonase/enoyl-CoA hydratase family protein [Pseudomonadales bacterium]|nr:crotonase/enoyl-CoA hydratase family protein [Pseudomonadales bacterium]
MSWNTIKVTIDERGVATLLLNRPEKHNSMNAELIAEVTEAAESLETNEKVRAVVLTGAGESFCAGGDLLWMKAMAEFNREERIIDSAKLATMLRKLNSLSKPLIGRINGQAYGGGNGMIAVCDVAIAVDSGKYCLTEVGLGLTPANIAPFVVAKMGQSSARRTFLNARPFSAAKGKELGLIDEVVSADELDATVEKELKYVLQCGPGAIAATKKLIFYVDSHDLATSQAYTAELLADTWDSDEGREGIRCFFAKETPSWKTKK